MSTRRKIPASAKATVLTDNLHTCCICHNGHFHVQLHHIDGDSGNYDQNNLAVLCLNCHSRVTSDEGLGQRYSVLEVAERKRRWEHQCAAALKNNAERLVVETAMRFRTSSELTGQDCLRPIFSNLKLAQAEGAKVGFEIVGSFGVGMFQKLTEILRRAGKLSESRPNTFDEYSPNQLVYEKVEATKIIIPSAILRTTAPGVRELAVWVADPAAKVLAARSDDLWDFSGTFLYLVTPLYDQEPYETFFSGCSALQVISNLVTGKAFITRAQDEPLGRNSYLHPTDKLRSLGGIVIDRRSIETLYACRYMSDEQCFNDGKAAYRGHDLLAYPLFIGNPFDSLLKSKGLSRRRPA